MTYADKRKKNKVKSFILTDLIFSKGARSSYDLWFTQDVKPEFEGVLTEKEVDRFLTQQASRKHGDVRKMGRGLYCPK